MDRRKLVSYSVNGLGVIMVGTVVVPAAIHGLSPAWDRDPGPEWAPVEQVALIPMGTVQTMAVAGRGIFVWRPSDEQIVVFSRSCTDLGCPLTWDSGSTWFYCPCHGGIFDQEGHPRAGPPDKPLWRFATRIRDGVLEIDMRSVPPMA